MRRSLFFYGLFLLLCHFGWSQTEDCTDGEDNDGDFLVDLNDDDCSCDPRNVAVNITSTGYYCSNDLVLNTETNGNGSFQWYLNGEALRGITTDFLNVSGNLLSTGTYQVVYTSNFNGSCVVDEFVVSDHACNPQPCAKPDLGEDIISCEAPVVLNAGAGFDSIIWQDGTIGQTYTVNTSGTYHVRTRTLGQNVITNGDFEDGDQGFTTDYVVGTGGGFGPISDPGTYLVTTRTDLAHDHFNDPVCFDHTADPGDQMMMVNGSSVVGESVWCQTITVLPNTTYQFSSWVWNQDTVGNRSASLSFYINGVEIGDGLNPDYEGCEWREFFTVWNSEANTNIEICIVNESTQAGGNDFALDDISFAPVCEMGDTINVNFTNCDVPACDKPDLGEDIASCTSPVSLSVPNGIYDSIVWSDGSTGTSLNVTQSGTYYVETWTLGENVIVNGDFEAGETGFTSQYLAGDPTNPNGAVWDEGRYTVVATPQDGHNNLPGNCVDHTVPGDSFMLVNGASVADVQVWCQTIPIIPGVDYEFSTWVWNYNSAEAAELSFSVNGNTLGGTFVANYGDCDWNQFAETWESDGSTSAEVCVVNQSVEADGNDFGLDDISFAPICKSGDTINVTISNCDPLTCDEPDLGPDTTLCEGPYMLDIGAGFDSILWSDGSTGQTYTVTETDTVWVRTWTLGENVIVNGDFEDGATGFDSQYNLPVQPWGIFGPLSGEGLYYVTNSTDNAHSNFNTPACGDHTPAPGDQMMVVNGAPIPDQNVWCQTVNVIEGMDYEFSTWVWNFRSNAPAQLSFFVNGVELGEFTTNYDGCVWNQFFDTWNSGTATTAEVCMVNQSTEADGNDFALDDISFAPICEEEDTVIITIQPCNPRVFGSGDTICLGDTATLVAWAQEGDSSDYTFNWTGDGLTTASGDSVTAVPSTSGNVVYNVTVTDGSNNTHDTTVIVVVLGDCDCDSTLVIGGPGGSLIPNPSFEDTLCCPLWDGTTGSYTLECAVSWQQATNNTSDFMHFCAEDDFPNNIPLPFPDGDAVARMIWSDRTREFIGTCLDEPMLAGGEYEITFSVALPINGTGGEDIPVTAFSFYGTPNCNELPIPEWRVCPPEHGNWELIGTLDIDPNAIEDNWTEVTITLYPTFDVRAFMMGAPCTLPATGYDDSRYFYIDNLQLQSTVSHNAQLDTIGSFCRNDLQVFISDIPGAVYQWYLNNQELPGETDTIVGISENNYGPGTYSVGVNLNNQCALLDIEIPLQFCNPQVTGLGDTICIGDTATLVAWGAGGDSSSYTFDWVGDGLITSTGDTVNAVPTTSGTLIYDVTVTDASNNLHDTTVILVVYALPLVTAEPDTAICLGDTATIRAGGATTYSWDNGLTTVPSASVSPTVTTTYTVTGTDINGCENTAALTVTVNTLPVVSAEDTQICKEDSVQLQATGATNYFWTSLNDGQILSDTNIADPWVFTGQPTATTDVQACFGVLGIDNNGCMDTAIACVSFEVNCGPLITALGDTICIGETDTLSAAATMGDGNFTFTWNGGNLVNATGATQTDNPTTTTEYTVIVTDGNNDRDTAIVQLVVNPLPTVIATEEDTICRGASDTIYATGAATYQWGNGPTDSSQLITPTVTTTYTVTGTDTNGCVNTDSVTITVDYVEAEAGDAINICEGGQAQLTASGGDTYRWTPNDGTLSSTTIANPIATPTDTTTYSVEVRSAIGYCVAYDSVTVNTGGIEVDLGPDIVICAGDIHQFNVGVIGNYSWSVLGGTDTLNNNSIADPVASPYVTSTYIVEVEDPLIAGCTDSDTIIIDVENVVAQILTVAQTICRGDDLPLTATGGGTYLWSPDNGSIDNVNSASPTVNPTNTTRYLLTVTTTSGRCNDTTSVLVEVDSIEALASADFFMCLGSTSSLLNVTAPGATSYSWSPATYLDNATIANPQVVNPTAAGTISYEVSVTNANNCTDKDTVEVTIGDVIVNAEALSPRLCVGDTGQVRATTTTTGALFSWQSNGGILIDTSSQTPGFTAADTGTYILTVRATDGSGQCPDIDSTTIAVENVYVDAGVDTVICKGQQFNLQGNYGPEYSWSPSALLDDSTIQNPELNTSESGEYQFILNVSDPALGCSESDTVNVLIEEVTVNAQINPTTIVEGEEAFYSVTTNGNYVTWWDVATDEIAFQGPYPEDRQFSAFPAITSTYEVHSENDIGCENTTEVSISVLNLIRIPNVFTPNEDGVNDTWKIANIEDYPDAEIRVTNRWGNVVWKNKDSYDNTWNGGNERGAALPIGTYYFDIRLNFRGLRYSGDVTILR